MSALELRQVVKRFGNQTAVAEVSLSLEPGERLALLGHNGAGKTTLMKLVLGLLRASSGALEVLGGAPGRAEARRQIGFLPENVAFHDAMSGWEVMDFYARLKRRPLDEAAELLRRVGLEMAAKRRVGTYSKGMRQRLGLAQALLGAPKLLLLDEPTTGLDPVARQTFYDIVRGLAADGCAVVLSSHLLTELEERTDRIAILDRGRLVALGTLEELRARAGLPLVFRFAVPGQGEQSVEQSGLRVTPEGARLRLEAPPAEKMAVLRRLVALPEITDIDMEAPSLDAVYAHFVGSEGEPSP
jgi:Cu-processing system ATP-binding protein